MKLLKAFLPLSLALLVPGTGLSQTKLPEEIIIEQFPVWQGLKAENLDYDQLDFFMQNRLEINSVSSTEIQNLEFLDESQKELLIDFLEENRPIQSMLELQVIKSFDHQTIKLLSQKFFIRKAPGWKRILKQIDNPDLSFAAIRLQTLAQSKKGFKTAQRLGGFSGPRTASRLRVLHRKYGHYSLGLLMDRDMGEGQNTSLLNHIDPYQFLSAHAFVEGGRRIKKMSIGDFAIQYGEGLVFSPGFRMGKGAETIYSIKNPELGLRPFSSAFENGGMRGAATTIGVSLFDVTVFLSRKGRHATVHGTSSEENFFTSFYDAGLFRNSREKQKMSSVDELSFGGVLSYRSKTENLKLNLEWKETRYDIPVQKRFSNSAFNFHGREISLFGLSGSYSRNGLLVFGEVALSNHQATGIVLGSIVNLNKHFDAGILARRLGSRFFSPSSRTFSELSTAQNENGIYVSLKWKPNHVWSVEGFSDIYSFPSLRHRSGSAASGSEKLVHFKFRPDRDLQVRLVLRTEKIKNENLEKGIEKFRSMGSIHKKLDERLKYGGRVYFNRQSSLQINRGYGLSQELTYAYGSLSITGFVGFFDTEDHQTRVFFFEKNVFWEYAIPAYSGTGSRYLLLIKFRILKKASFWMRLAHTRFSDRKSIGNGMDTIDGNQMTELKGLLKWNLF